MVHPYNRYVLKALQMAEALMDAANKGEADCDDDGCRILFGVMRDCAYKIRKHAERQSQPQKADRGR